MRRFLPRSGMRAHPSRVLAALSFVLAGCTDATAPQRRVEQGAGETGGGNATTPPPARFRVGFVDLGLLPGATGGQANAINEGGQIVGTMAFASDVRRAFRWTACTRLEDLSPFLGGGSSLATDINDRGDIVGNAGGAFRLSASGALLALGPTPGNSTAITFATGINNAGVVVGGMRRPGQLGSDAVRWDESGAPRVLAGGHIAEAINVRGEIVGTIRFSDQAGLYWATPDAVPIRVGLYDDIFVTDINDANPAQIVGYASTQSVRPNDPTFPFRQVNRAWISIPGGPARELGTFGGQRSSSSEAHAINNQAQVVGTSDGRPFIWTQAGGLQELTMPAGYTNGIALELNERGMVVGVATAPDGQQHPVLWIVQPLGSGTGGTNAVLDVQSAAGSCSS